MKLASAVLVLSLWASHSALAADSQFYVYGSAGLTDAGKRKGQTDAAIANNGATAFTSGADEKDYGYKLQAGYCFNRHLAIEGGYAALGKTSYNAAATAPAATLNSRTTTKAWTLWPQWALFPLQTALRSSASSASPATN